ncbi:hypothetical protein DEU34_2244 [Microbacterium sp. AG1240]|uniref:hypothetical protein n=1 Tax=Microbacterium sp. AG1240 TaxID=2183992 RepID=UPI000EB41D9C|nr:hypothetical protein [Microbacterium sp. AG1240]RKT33641.1 hypothetical protein DEU34_2244 [Microbacterium sp. AG1240]
MSTHLWEHDHPYYCSEGNYFKTGMHTVYESWVDFAQPSEGRSFNDEWNLLYDFDDDLNLLWRWDWKKADPENYWRKPGDPNDETAQYVEDQKVDRLELFFMLQRKAYNISVEVKVTEADEPAVREWLIKKASHMRLLWAPLLGQEPS